MHLFNLGDYRLKSGVTSNWKIDCDALTEEDWKTLAAMAVTLLPPFGAVEGVPRGGLKFAEALQHYITSGPLLIAEDVVTTGKSMENIRNGRNAIGIAVFQREECANWIKSLFHCHVDSWSKVFGFC